ncbi:motility twitching protein PilT [Emticicia aquatilis]|uniref:Motility twitching protein PilT n=1 Tax=Emticicia aquatilis TaxID=1537369 RepID=A0A916Z5K3_9BACT|nr:type II toxin-antitoxin system VapC family toxin [Emticicia aquatilis]GGD76782.1 motility twitching protein PilT [Emticicia aquatilis]
MGKKYILDTNAIIDFVGDKLPQAAAFEMDKIIDIELNISIIVKIEVLGFNGDPLEMQKIADFLMYANILYVDDIVADKAIHLRKTYKKLKLGDALIAATALVYDLVILTRNTKDFQNITNLEYINPHELG